MNVADILASPHNVKILNVPAIVGIMFGVFGRKRSAENESIFAYVA
jgi:hypothetical protein